MEGTRERFLCRLAAYEPKVFQFDHLFVDVFIRGWGIPSYVSTIPKNNYSSPLQTFYYHYLLAQLRIQELSSKIPAEVSGAYFLSLSHRKPKG